MKTDNNTIEYHKPVLCVTNILEGGIWKDVLKFVGSKVERYVDDKKWNNVPRTGIYEFYFDAIPNESNPIQFSTYKYCFDSINYKKGVLCVITHEGDLPLTLFHIDQWLKYHHSDTYNNAVTHYNKTTIPNTNDNMPTDDNTPTQPPPTTPPFTLDPYQAMVTDITNRVIDKMPPQQMDEGKVEEIARRLITSQGRLLITIEDRRKSPTEIKDIAEPVHHVMPDVIGIMKAGCWVCAVGPTGSGKTLGALQYARIADIKIVCIKQMTRILAPHDLVGYMDANGKYRSGAWTNAILGKEYDNTLGVPPTGLPDQPIPAMIVVDEMDNANENIIMLIKALQTGYITMPYGLQQVNPSLSVMATMNTWGTGATREYVGRMAQDAALLNEFSFVEWDYDTDFEWCLLENLFNNYKTTGDYTITHMQMLHALMKGMRAKATANKIRVIISTRNLINTAKKLLENPTWSIHKVLCMDIYKGLKEEDIKRVECPEQWTAIKGQHHHNKVVATPDAGKQLKTLKRDDAPF